MGFDSTEHDQAEGGTVVFPRGEPGRFTKYHTLVCASLAGFFVVMFVIVLWTGDDTGPMTVEAMAFIGIFLGTAVSAAVSGFTASEGYAASVVPGLLTAIGLLVLGTWLMTMQFAGDDPNLAGVVLAVIGVVVAMTSIAAWMELRRPPSQPD